MLFVSKPTTLLCILLLVGHSLAQPTLVDQHDDHDDHHEDEDHDDDHDDDHDHDHDEEDSFTHLLEIVGSESEYIDDEAFVNLTKGLLVRFDTCTGVCAECFSLTSMKTLLNVDPATSFNFTEETFSEPAQVILEILLRENCSSINSTHLGISFGVDAESSVTDLLQRLKPIYEAEHDVTKCFNAHVLFEDGLSGDNLTYQVLVNLFEGYCLYPTDHELEDSLFEHFGVEGDDVSDAVFDDFLNDLGIGSVADAAAPEEDDHDDHGHARKRRSLDGHVIVKRQTDDDHEHEDEHEDEHGHEEEESQCYSGSQLKAIYGLSGNLTRDTLLSMCPSFIQQIISGSCNARAPNATTGPATDSNYTDSHRYGYGTVAVAVISLLAFVGILFFPVLSTSWFKLVMQFFIALGVGTLSGDAILHIIPEIVGLHGHEAGDAHDHENEDRSYVWKLLVVIAGIWGLFIFETLMKLILGKRHANQHNQSTVNAHIHVAKFTSSEAPNGDIPSEIEETKDGKKTDPPVLWGLNTVCIMILIGDTLCNFGDGIAIGAAFSVSWVQGIGASIAIFCHELPHEFGDFAIYMRNDLTKWKALLLNFMAACCAFIGLYVGLALSTNSEVRQWLLAVVAGMFLYIAFVNVLHEMVEEETGFPVAQFIVQNVGMLLGWAILLILSLYEDQLINSISA
uniref:Zinc transporter ZIP12 n=1 Tax=Phallusia mammillata TaxID=59560 RepID=A0A6F9DS41_9ASCI|nr:zinc transporter ZIP12 [Phallusia mammillata]